MVLVGQRFDQFRRIRHPKFYFEAVPAEGDPSGQIKMTIRLGHLQMPGDNELRRGSSSLSVTFRQSDWNRFW
jgi:hypothetical protein